MKLLCFRLFRILLFVAILFSLPSVCFADSELVKQAEGLFKLGPTKADEIEELLNRELELRPKNHWARYLRGKVYYFGRKCEKALTDFETASKLLKAEDESINSHYEMYQAKTLYCLKRCAEAKALLEGRYAFWESYPKLKHEYDALYPILLRECGEKKQAR